MRFKLFLLLLFTYTISYGQINNQNQNFPQQNYNANQVQNFSGNTRINTDMPEIMGFYNSQTIQKQSVAIDKLVDPSKYIVGPNDEFILGIYGYLNQQLPIVVNIEGTITIPTIGEVKVGGITLAEAKSKVINSVKKRYYSSEVSFNLNNPKSFLIYVTGLSQKSFVVTSMSRLGDIISYVLADTINIIQNQYRSNNTKLFFVPQVSLRNIEIKHKDGTVSAIDLYRYFFSREDEDNPYLKEGDLIRIPYEQLDKNYITVEGAVSLTGAYEYNKKDNLEMVINLGRGFAQNAEPDSIIVFRNDPETSKFDQFNLSYDKDKEFKINLYDRVFVKYKSNYVKIISVTVLGEVNRPGVYPITFKNTKLKEILELAGGFKPTAYLPLSIVFRKVDEEYYRKDTTEIFINMRANDLIVNEKDKLNFQMDVLSKRSRMIVDFEKLYKYNDESQNIILEDKDVIYINDDKKVVYVYGQVQNEGYVPLKYGADYEYYIEKAGGYTLAADEGDTRVIKFNTRGWYKPDQTEVQSGDFIYVPKKTPTEFSQTFSIIATTVGIITSLLTTYLLIKNQSK